MELSWEFKNVPIMIIWVTKTHHLIKLHLQEEQFVARKWPIWIDNEICMVEYDFLSSNLFNHQWPGNLQVRWATIFLIPIQREGKPLISALATEAIMM